MTAHASGPSGDGILTVFARGWHRLLDLPVWNQAADFMWSHLWIDQLLVGLVGVWLLRVIGRLARIPGHRRRARAAYAASLRQTRASITTPNWSPVIDPHKSATPDPFASTSNPFTSG